MPKIKNLSESAQILAIPPQLYKHPQDWFRGRSGNPALDSLIEGMRKLKVNGKSSGKMRAKLSLTLFNAIG